ncbi:MAG TPA: hypothetical protein VG993_00740 [Actinomycetota bacterium]|nr:hypothetical protein [Actinomycetota bacterium]
MTTHVPPTMWTEARRAEQESREHRPRASRRRMPDRVHQGRGLRLRGRIRMPQIFRHVRRGA